MEEIKEKKKFNGIGIWKFLNKIPAGTMFVPLVISAIICSICIACGLGTGKLGAGMTLWEYLGNPMKDLFGKTGQMLVIGLMLFCTGTMIKPHDFVEVFKRGIWIILARLLPAYIISALVFIFCPDGFLGIDPVTFCVCITSANAALYMGIIPPYADNSDRATFPIMLIFSMPLLPFIVISCFGTSEGDAGMIGKIMQIISLLLPFILGFVLGNLDPKIREVFKGGNAILLPFLGFQFGSTINLAQAFTNGMIWVGAIVLILIFWAVTITIPYIVDRFALKRPGYASIGSSSLAGVALSIPLMFVNYTFSGSNLYTQNMADNGVLILAIVLLITNILDPFFTKWTMNYYFKSHQGEKMADPKRVFEKDHPELLAAVYDENGMYRTHHHNHEIFKKVFHLKSHKEDVNTNDQSK